MATLDDLGAKLLSEGDVTALFPDAWWLEVFHRMPDPKPPVHFIDGSLAIDELAPGAGPWAVIVHGDLHATGNLDFRTSDYETSLLVVQGNVRARNFRFTNGATCVVAQDLDVTDYVIGRYGDESARLEVGGTLRARAVLLDHVTGVEAKELDAIVCTTEGWGLPIDIDYNGDHHGVFAHHVLDGDRLDLRLAWQALVVGAPLLLPDAEAALRAGRRR